MARDSEKKDRPGARFHGRVEGIGPAEESAETTAEVRSIVGCGDDLEGNDSLFGDADEISLEDVSQCADDGIVGT